MNLSACRFFLKPYAIIILFCCIQKVSAQSFHPVDGKNCSENQNLLDIERSALQSEWATWFSKNASVTPFGALNLHTDWAITENQLNAIYQQPQHFPFAKNSRIAGKPVEEIGIPGLQMAQGPGARDQAMISKMKEAIAAGRKDELLVIFVGEAHAIDLFMNLPDPQNIAFVSFPKHQATMTESDGVVKAMKALGQEGARTTVQEDSAASQAGVAARLYYYERETGQKIAWSKFVQGLPDKPGVIVIMDYHAIEVEAGFNVLPSPNALSKLGFSKTKILMEGFPSKEVTDEQMAAKYDFGKTYETQQPAQAEIIKYRFPKAWKIFQSGEAVVYPELKDLHQRISEYRAKGFEVELRGLE
jgi:hypothetical protein